jgi:hypothetical protein
MKITKEKTIAAAFFLDVAFRGHQYRADIATAEVERA